MDQHFAPVCTLRETARKIFDCKHPQFQCQKLTQWFHLSSLENLFSNFTWLLFGPGELFLLCASPIIITVSQNVMLDLLEKRTVDPGH